ncbi:hypothetical protein FB567DRAFT_555830 [Paraphoma chrysanthemicola]|uniref:Uncharacterized protein n=1 Tax=Paraphoma chrysanthemicola TaxID=798071 RepID=A0A8K0QS06_9PLEO|nr:hypothetical protein FB567DRAFT_555830 [Paraphoma chrysanthemicola]
MQSSKRRASTPPTGPPQKKLDQSVTAGSAGSLPNDESAHIMIPDESTGLVQALLAFQSLLTSEAPVDRLQMLWTNKKQHLDEINRALKPGDMVTRIQERPLPLPTDVQITQSQCSLDAHFWEKSQREGQAPDWLENGSWIQKWLQDPHCVALLSCAFDMCTKCPAILPAICRTEEHIRLQVGRQWIEQTKFVFVGRDDINISDEIGWFRAFLSNFADPEPASDCVRSFSFLYWSGLMTYTTSLRIIQDCSQLNTIELGIHPRDINYLVYLATIRNNIETGDFRAHMVQKVVERYDLIQLSIPDPCFRNPRRVPASYNGYWLRDIGTIVKSSLMRFEHHRETKLFIDWGSSGVELVTERKASESE